VAVCASVSLFAVGCSKSAQSPGANAQTPQITNEAAPEANANEAQPASPSQPGATAPATTAKSAEPDLGPLNHALIQWRVQHRRVPANFEEFAASADINIPPPPQGKKYIINGHGLISLVNAN